MSEISRNMTSHGPRKPRLVAFGAMTAFFFLVFCGLGIWQIERLSWKLALIARVDQWIHMPATPAPVETQWPSVSAEQDEYRHVSVAGHFLHGKEALVYASTERGPGYWVMTPLQTADGAVIFINRGYVPLDRKDQASRREGQLAGEVTVTGLLRLNEPRGTLLRSNDPKDGRWYSRDVAAMGKTDGLDRVAPFFIDADAAPNPGGLPVGGLTVVSFPNSHLSYALTWFAMATLSLVGGAVLIRVELKRTV